MTKRRKQIILTMALTGLLVLTALFIPKPVRADQIDIEFTEHLYFAIQDAKAGDILNVIADIDVGKVPLTVKNKNPFTITSTNNSKITSSGKRFLILEPGVNLTLAGNLRLEAMTEQDGIYIDQAELTVKDQVSIHVSNADEGIRLFSSDLFGERAKLTLKDQARVQVINAKEGIRLYYSDLDMAGGRLSLTGLTVDRARIGIRALGNSSVIIRQGGQVQLENTAKPDHTGTPYTGVFLEGSQDLGASLTLTKGKISVKSQRSAVGLQVLQNCTALINGNEAIIQAYTTEIYPIGVFVLNGGYFKMVAGKVDAQSQGNAYACEAIQASFKSQVDIVPSKKTDKIEIYSPSRGIFLDGVDNLVNYHLDGNHIFSPALQDGRVILNELPRKLALTAGKSYRMKLHGVHKDVTFAVDPATSYGLHAVKGDNKDQFILTSHKEGEYRLRLTTTTGKDGPKNTITLHIPVSVTPVPFKDVKIGDWPLDYIMYLFREGVIKGYPSGNFKPDDSIRRDHVAKMVAIGAGLDWQGKKAKFPDVDPNDEMSPYIAALVEAGAIGGYPDGTFRPDQHIERGHAAKIVAKAFKLNMGTLPSNFPDLPPGQDGEAVKFLASNGIVKGYKDGSFGPKKYITRAEFSKILTIARVVSRIQQAEASVGSWLQHPGKTKMALIEAQELVDILPLDQDIKTRNYLQGRLDGVRTKLP